jgi:uncharacterized membrane protein
MLAKIASWVVRLGGLVMIVLGLLFWTGNATNLVNEHMTLGVIVVLALWLLAGIYATRKGASIGLAAGAFLTGIVVAVVGMTQTQLLPGSGHIVIEVLHLLLGLTLISFGEIIIGRLRRMDSGASVAAA